MHRVVIVVVVVFALAAAGAFNAMARTVIIAGPVDNDNDDAIISSAHCL